MSRKFIFVVVLTIIASAAGAYTAVTLGLSSPPFTAESLAEAAAKGAIGGGVLFGLVAYVFGIRGRKLED
jgi:hypothetical protein